MVTVFSLLRSLRIRLHKALYLFNKSNNKYPKSNKVCIDSVNCGRVTCEHFERLGLRMEEGALD